MARGQVQDMDWGGAQRKGPEPAPWAAPLGGEAWGKEGRQGEAGRTAALLVRVVPAVIVVVALPTARHAAVVLAAELVWLTGALI